MGKSIVTVKEGSYIVTIEVKPHSTACAKNGWCFKQGKTARHMCPALDLHGSGTNANSTVSFDKRSNLIDWRFATPEEIAEYERVGKPYNTIGFVPPKPKVQNNYEIY